MLSVKKMIRIAKRKNRKQATPLIVILKNRYRVSCCIILCLFTLFSKLHSLFPCLCKSIEKRKSQLILYYQLLILFTQSVIPILIFHFNYVMCIYTKRVSNHKVEKIRCAPCIMSVWISLFSLPAMEWKESIHTLIKWTLFYVIYHVTAYFVDEKYGFLCCQSVTSWITGCFLLLIRFHYIMLELYL